MSFQQGLSGLSASSKQLDVIGNNIANSSTAGFKSSRTQFADVYANSLYTGGTSLAGAGTLVSTVAQQFTQGNISTTNNPLDVAINGGGFFVLQNGNYTRNGQFQTDSFGYLTDANGVKVMGLGTGGGLSELQISFESLTPVPTSELSLSLNLNSTSTALNPASFHPGNSSTYNSSTPISIYDEAGNQHTLRLFFVKDSTVATGLTWQVYGTLVNSSGSTVALDGSAIPAAPAVIPPLGAMTFNSDGTLATAPFATLNIDTSALGTGAGDINITTASFAGSTLYGSGFKVYSSTQNGYAPGDLIGVSISNDGYLQGRYSNGYTKDFGQMALVNFNNPQGLNPVGNNQWSKTRESGDPSLPGAPGTGTLGVLKPSAVEESNVDLTAELVNLIVAQRIYQANAQTITAQSTILQTLVNIR